MNRSLWYKVQGLFLGLLLLFMILLPNCSGQKEVLIEPSIQHVLKLNKTVQIGFGDSFSIQETELAVFIFYHCWLQTFGDKNGTLLDALTNFTVIWVPDNWTIKNVTVFNEDGKKIQVGKNGVILSGITLNKTLIKVAINKQTISNTSFVHELVHIALWHTNPESQGDPDHQGTKYPGWTEKHSAFISMVNQLIAIELKRGRVEK